MRRPQDMPQNTFSYRLWLPETGRVIKRIPFIFGKDRPSEVRSVREPTALLYKLYQGDIPELVDNMERLSRHACKEIDRTRKRPVVGAKRVYRIHPWDEPRTLRERGGQRNPLFKLGAAGFTPHRQRIKPSQEVTAFRTKQRAQYYRFKDSHYDELFPDRIQKLNLREGVRPARIVVHRDARRGRPKKGSSDPPA